MGWNDMEHAATAVHAFVAVGCVHRVDDVALVLVLQHPKLAFLPDTIGCLCHSSQQARVHTD